MGFEIVGGNLQVSPQLSTGGLGVALSCSKTSCCNVVRNKNERGQSLSLTDSRHRWSWLAAYQLCYGQELNILPSENAKRPMGHFPSRWAFA
jgi:hypothetical protein